MSKGVRTAELPAGLSVSDYQGYRLHFCWGVSEKKCVFVWGETALSDKSSAIFLVCVLQNNWTGWSIGEVRWVQCESNWYILKSLSKEQVNACSSYIIMFHQNFIDNLPYSLCKFRAIIKQYKFSNLHILVGNDWHWILFRHFMDTTILTLSMDNDCKALDYMTFAVDCWLFYNLQMANECWSNQYSYK